MELRYPHCDPRVIHAPGECNICDQYAAKFQEIRKYWNINFTGHKDPDKQPCPADVARGDGHKKWGGNTAKKNPCRNCKKSIHDHDEKTKKCLYGPGDWTEMSNSEAEALWNEEMAAIVRRVKEQENER